MPIKSTTPAKVGGGNGRKTNKQTNKRIYRTSPNIKVIIVFLESLLSESFLAGSSSPPYLPRMPSNSGLAVGAAQILIWSYSRVFLPPISTAIRTSVLSFVGALSVLLYIP